MTSVFLTVRDKSVYRHIQDPDISVRRGSTVLDSRTKKVETSATRDTEKNLFTHSMAVMSPGLNWWRRVAWISVISGMTKIYFWVWNVYRCFFYGLGKHCCYFTICQGNNPPEYLKLKWQASDGCNGRQKALLVTLEMRPQGNFETLRRRCDL